MPTPVDPNVLEPLVEMLVETSDPGARDRLLLDAPQLLGVAPAVALWRLGPARDGRAAAWREVLARGPRELLPDAGRVAAVADGRAAPELAGRGTVLVAGVEDHRRALCLGGLLDDAEPIVDLLEALLCTYAALEEAWEPRSNPLLDHLAPALPSAARTAQATGLEARLRHDVRNHLASIRSTRELLERFGPGLAADERDHFHAVLEREVRRARDLLIRAAQRDQAPPACAGSTPAAVARDVVESERAACEGSGIALRLDAAPGTEGLRTSLSEVDLDRALRNLLVNARQALEASPSPSPCIQVAVRARGGGFVELVVADNGPGIAPEALGELWKEGYTRGKRGSGLGLAVVRELALSAGGSVDAGSAHGGGARFTVAIPCLGSDGREPPRSA